MPSPKEPTPDALRMRRRRAHADGDHAACLPSSCMLTLRELQLVRALLQGATRAETVRFTQRRGD